MMLLEQSRGPVLMYTRTRELCIPPSALFCVVIENFSVYYRFSQISKLPSSWTVVKCCLYHNGNNSVA